MIAALPVELRRPLHRKGNTNSTFQHIHFIAAQWQITLPCSARERRSVIAQENDERIVKNIICRKRLHDLPDAIIQRNDHGGIDATRRIRDIGNSLHVLIRGCVMWGVDRVISQVKKEWLTCMSIDEGDRLLREFIG